MLPKIALVAPSLANPGGQGVQAALLATKLRRDGYDVTFIPTDPPFPRRWQGLKRIPYVRTLMTQMRYLPSLRQLRRADVVHVFSASYWSFVLGPLPAILLGKRWGKRVVLNYHSGEAEDHLSRWGLLVHPWLRMVDEIVVPSNYLRRVFAGHGYRARLVRNVVDTCRFHYRKRAPLRPRFLSSRNLEPYYDVDNTLLAFALVRTRYPEATLTIAGSGSQAEELYRLGCALGLGGIDFAGRVDPSDMPWLYENTDIFLNSSRVDNQPISVLEALASGLPVITTGVGDLPSLVEDGVTGLIVPQGDPGAMARAASQLLEQPDRAHRMAYRANERMEAFTWSHIREEWADVYVGHHDEPTGGPTQEGYHAA